VLLLSMLGGVLLCAALEVVFAFDVVAVALAGVACRFTSGAWIVYGVRRLPAPAGLLAFLRHASAWPSYWRGP
jgi:hypothetical protein